MKILYTTDLHGRSQYYNLIWKAALQNKVDMVINGGDLLLDGTTVATAIADRLVYNSEILIMEGKSYRKR